VSVPGPSGPSCLCLNICNAFHRKQPITLETLLTLSVETTPQSECVLLENETEVLVSPKVRGSLISQPQVEEPMRAEVAKETNVPFISAPLEEEDFDTKFKSTDSNGMVLFCIFW